MQVWRRSSPELLATLRLPVQAGGHHEHPAEPRRLANGEVLVNTFTCGLYRIVGVGSDRRGIEPMLHAPFDSPTWCAVPVVLGTRGVEKCPRAREIQRGGPFASPNEVD